MAGVYGRICSSCGKRVARSGVWLSFTTLSANAMTEWAFILPITIKITDRLVLRTDIVFLAESSAGTL